MLTTPRGQKAGISSLPHLCSTYKSASPKKPPERKKKTVFKHRILHVTVKHKRRDGQHPAASPRRAWMSTEDVCHLKLSLSEQISSINQQSPPSGRKRFHLPSVPNNSLKDIHTYRKKFFFPSDFQTAQIPDLQAVLTTSSGTC